jgi:hypothetical protein
VALSGLIVRPIRGKKKEIRIAASRKIKVVLEAFLSCLLVQNALEEVAITAANILVN